MASGVTVWREPTLQSSNHADGARPPPPAPSSTGGRLTVTTKSKRTPDEDEVVADVGQQDTSCC